METIILVLAVLDLLAIIGIGVVVWRYVQGFLASCLATIAESVSIEVKRLDDRIEQRIRRHDADNGKRAAAESELAPAGSIKARARARRGAS